MMKNQKGITLIALVITIIVLLILAGVSIAMLTGDNGVLNKANKAKTSTVAAEASDKINMAINAEYASILADKAMSGTTAEAIAKTNGISTADFDIVPASSVTESTVLTIKPKAGGAYSDFTNLEGKITYDSSSKQYSLSKSNLDQLNTTPSGNNTNTH